MKTIATHNGGFHADDVFACATLLLIYPDAKVIRTRDNAEIEKADIVFDVGRIYDGEKYFDHHQEGGAGMRENKIPYASFGLIWKHFGTNLVSNNSLSYVDKILVQSIDATDNGVDFAENILIKPFTISDVAASFNPLDDGNVDFYPNFLEAVNFAKVIIKNVIKDAEDISESLEIYKKAFEEALDKRLVVSKTKIRKEVLSSIEGVIYVVVPYHNNTWSVRAVRLNEDSFESRKPLPEAWAGKSPEDLQIITGVKDANFCHNKRFVANARSLEGAIALAELALKS